MWGVVPTRFPAREPALAALLASLSLAACGGSSSPASHSAASVRHPSQSTALGNRLVQAADVSGASKGYKISLRMTEAVSSVQINAAGTGSFNVPKKAGELNLRMELPASTGEGPLNVREIVEHGAMYMHLPAALSGKLSGGRPWFKVDLAQVGQAAGISGLSSLTGGQSSDPGQFLQYLQAASSSGIRNLGSATINGVATTHYEGQLELAKVVSARSVPSGRRAAAAKAIAQLQKLTGLSRLPVEVWVDSAHLVRQIAMTYGITVPGGLGKLNMTMQMDFTAYGPQPVPALPPAGQVDDISSLLGSHLASAGASGAA
jgi:hypothetical protein